MMSGEAGVKAVREESRVTMLNRLKAEGRWEEASLFKDRVISELRMEGMRKIEAGETAWREVARMFPPLLEEEGDGEGTSDATFGLLPRGWPVLPETAAWVEELEWAYQNGFFVIVERAGGAGGVSYRWERASCPAPSRGALVLMKLLAESRQKFMDLLGKAKTGVDTEDTEVVKRERRRVEEIEGLLEGLKEEE